MKRGYYAILPANVRYDNKLTPNAKLLYAEITALCNKEGFCWATNEYFADLYSMSKSSISRNISSLVEGQYLNISFTENRTKRKLSLRVRKNDKGGTQKQVGGVRKNEYHNNKVNNKSNIYSFQEFYDDYGKKVSRTAAEKAFKKLTVNDLQKIKEVLPQWKKQYVKQKEYQPHPSTWLNQRRWEDDLINDKQNVYRRDYKVLK